MQIVTGTDSVVDNVASTEATVQLNCDITNGCFIYLYSQKYRYGDNGGSMLSGFLFGNTFFGYTGSITGSPDVTRFASSTLTLPWRYTSVGNNTPNYTVYATYYTRAASTATNNGYTYSFRYVIGMMKAK